MNMFKPVNAKSAKAYFDALPPERRVPMRTLDALIRKAVPSWKPNFIYNMPGYGSFKYRSYTGKIMDWPVVAIASQKQYMSVYVCAVMDGKYLAESHKRELGKVDVGRSCIRFRKLEDVNLPALVRVIKLAAKTPGLIGAKERRKTKR